MRSILKITDQLKRPLRDLRISVTDKCNFRCKYCMPAEVFGPDFAFLPYDQILSFEEITRLVDLFVDLGVEKIRITGGEPLLRKDVDKLIYMINQIKEVKDIALTTNGSMLKKYAEALKKAGLKRITVSLDSLDDARFKQMNDRDYPVEKVLSGIEAAQRAGLIVKINMVVQKGINDQDILPMARYFKNKGHILRFIEYMDVGNYNGWKLDHVLSSKDIVEMIHRELPLEPVDPNYYGEVATRYRYQDGSSEIGFISSVTQSFCSTCTRMRLSADGHLYTCLFGTEGYDIKTPLRKETNNENIKKMIVDIWNQRTDKYSENRLKETKKVTRNKVEMSHIGG